MTSKKKKAAKRSINDNRRPSPERLRQLIEFIPRNAKLVDQESNNLGLTKSWIRETTSRCNAGGEKLRKYPQLYHLDDSPNVSLQSTLYYRNCTADARSTRIFPSNHASKYFAAIVSHPLSSSLQLSGDASPSLVGYTLKDSKDGCPWNRYKYTLTNYECNVIDPFDAKRKCLQFTSITAFGGSILALSLQGALVAMKQIDSRLTITSISPSRAVPSASSRFFREYLVRLNGELLLVFLINQKTIRVVDRVELFRLDFPGLKWIKVERIQGTTLFLDQYNLQVHSGETSSRRNCVYFTNDSDKKWWIYEMETGLISAASEDKTHFGVNP
ncbi:hypothetical protein ABFX02_03G015400 [Erythranthe guttata]